MTNTCDFKNLTSARHSDLVIEKSNIAPTKLKPLLDTTISYHPLIVFSVE